MSIEDIVEQLANQNEIIVAATNQQVDGAVKSLQNRGAVEVSVFKERKVVLTEKGTEILTSESPEVKIFNAVSNDGILKSELETLFSDDDIIKEGFGICMKKRYFNVEKRDGDMFLTKRMDIVEDETQKILNEINNNPSAEIAKNIFTDLRRRKLVETQTFSNYKLSKGPYFDDALKPLASHLTQAIIVSNTSDDYNFKMNFNTLGQPCLQGQLHPLLKMKELYKKIFISMGFQEMVTNNYVESSFWNFDTLWLPQQHPARDAQDTFFMKNPAEAKPYRDGILGEYWEKTRSIHEKGGYGSIGYRYDWNENEAMKNVLRTHTTACSSRLLFKLAQNNFKPMKIFSIDRVFRNETVDATHLAEFHQVEGVVCGKGLTLGHLIGIIQEFFNRLGIKELRFKPAFNPYTEPSMEIMSYMESRNEWVEVGNSGLFRPEMLRPMGLPEDVIVCGWGLSLERPTMIKTGRTKIRELFGHDVDMELIKKTGCICN
eukprot:TRINITY_DN3183_c3_g3_i2.p2 TRINITY_DN3183_c3_g3~~TRINITY_DN3183_c3_g3_i2.p2  ORF type:complete len:488 (+),score=154.44 TRINITY_DN3183_c3_g3_i2:26-1489(+)